MNTSSPQNKAVKPSGCVSTRKKRQSIKVLTLNCQSIKNKPELLQNMTDSLKPDIIIGTESWLHSDIHDR